jgi:hypothetical protein
MLSLTNIDNKDIVVYAFGDLHGDIDALRILLEDCSKVIRPFSERKWDRLLNKKLKDKHLKLDYLIDKNFDIFQLFDKHRRIRKLFPSWNPKCTNTVLVITGDMVDNIKRETYMVSNCHVGFRIQEELKIILCLKLLDWDARKYNSRVITLLGNHEDMNIYYPNKRFFCDDNTYYESVRRIDFFKKYHKLFDTDGQKLIIFKINSCIFMHGGMTEQIIKIFKDKMKTNDISLSIEQFIDKINRLYNESYTDVYRQMYSREIDILRDRTFGDLNDRSNNQVCDQLSKVFDHFNIDGHTLIVGHCVQTYLTFKTSKKYLHFFHKNIIRSKDVHIINGSTKEIDIYSSLSALSKYYDFEKNRFPRYLGITASICNDDTNNKIYRLDVGMSKAFDEEKMYKDFSRLYDETKNYRRCEIFTDKIDPNMINKLDSSFSYSIKKLFYLLIKYIVSRSPQLLYIKNYHNQIVRGSLVNTLKKMNRILDNHTIIPSEDHPLHIPFIAVVSYIDNSDIMLDEFKKN